MLGPVVAALGLVAVTVVIRTRWRVRHSLYESLREERRLQVEVARRRAVGETAGSLPPSPIIKPGAGNEMETVSEPLTHAIAGHIALVGGLVVILLGVLLLVAAAR